MKFKTIILSVATVAVAGLCSCSGDKKAESIEAAEATEVTAQAAEATEEASIFAGLAQDLNADPNLPMVIDFNATWCGPCKRFAPIFEAAEKTYAGKAQFISIDIDEHPELAEAFSVTSIPTVAFIGTDDSLDVSVGLMTTEEFDEFLTKNLQ